MIATPLPALRVDGRKLLDLNNCLVDNPRYWVVKHPRSPIPVILDREPTAASGKIIGSSYTIGTANRILRQWISADNKKKKDRRDHALYTAALALLVVAISMVPVP